MQINMIKSDSFNFYVGDYELLCDMKNVPVLPMFSDKVVDFLSELSNVLLKNSNNRSMVDVYSYAYWIRRASLNIARTKHKGYEDRLGRGIAFHVAPSNIPVNFAVSMTSSLLAGNVTCIRVSNKKFKQVDVICKAINYLIANEFGYMRRYLCIFQYEHSEAVTQWLSDMCDVRVIWGGDRTVKTIRRAALPSRSIELAFSDRYSLALIDADKYLNSREDKGAIARGFYNDTYYSDQNACSSPRLIVWLGAANRVSEAKEIFWAELHRLAEQDYDMKPIQSIDKWNSFCELAMKGFPAHLISGDNLIVRIKIDSLSEDIFRYKNGGGYFFEYDAKKLEDIIPALGKKCQTISFYGVNKSVIKKLVFNSGVRGVDRIVPMGHTMGLEFIWDGYKMIEAMSRVVYLND